MKTEGPTSNMIQQVFSAHRASQLSGSQPNQESASSEPASIPSAGSLVMTNVCLLGSTVSQVDKT